MTLPSLHWDHCTRTWCHWCCTLCNTVYDWLLYFVLYVLILWRKYKKCTNKTPRPGNCWMLNEHQAEFESNLSQLFPSQTSIRNRFGFFFGFGFFECLSLDLEALPHTSSVVILGTGALRELLDSLHRGSIGGWVGHLCKTSTHLLHLSAATREYSLFYGFSSGIYPNW